MRVFIFLIAGFLTTCFTVIGQNLEKNQYNDLLVIDYKVSGVINSGQANMICRELMKDENIVFCDINSDFSKMTVVSITIKEIELDIRGSRFETGTSKSFSKDDFINLYSNSCLKNSTTEKENDLPVFIDSGNSVKDDMNYNMVKSIYIELHPDNYKNLIK